MDATKFVADSGGLHLVVYAGDNKILLAMSLPDEAVNANDKALAGFAIWRTYAGKPEAPLQNRITFTEGVNADAPAPKWTDSDKAPFQKFRWIDVPPDGFDAPITYRVQALYFTGQGSATKPGPEAKVTVSPVKQLHKKFRPAFTRGYIASQAYADKFHNKDIRPTGPKTADFDTAPFKAQYQWLGADAYQQLFAFIADCEKDSSCRVDVFAYDLDEPDVIAAICRIGKQGRLRAILDNAPLHAKQDKKTGQFPIEVKAAQMIIEACGAAQVKQGHFNRFQHNKVFIKLDANGKAQRVLFGSMNFSVRGIYVQANNIIVVDDPGVAGMFATAFDVAFKTDVKAKPFQQDKIAQGYMTGSAADTADLPKFSLALSPHSAWKMSLGPMSDRIRAAKSSVLFAVMAPEGQGPVLASLRAIAAQPTVFSYGTVETDKGLAVQTPNGEMGEVTGFAALTKTVPWPFTKEFSGGSGMHIHDKLVVVDFNADNPTVFCGSSNLAAGGEEANGDSLAMIEDEATANMYAIEAVALFDHYHFRKAAQNATKATPLSLWFPGKPGAPPPWWQPYYDKTKIQLRDRYLFADLPLPAGLATTKNVDWSAFEAEASKPKKGASAKKTGAAAKKSPAEAKPAKKASAKKAPAKKAKKTAAKKRLAKKRPAKKKAAKKKAAAKKRPARKASAKRTSRRKARR
jgi:phosphatidylserine/phosphatidylglycerophosphate/cardiolipin synthase-like enzyme